MTVISFLVGSCAIWYCIDDIRMQRETGKTRVIEVILFLIAGMCAIAGSGSAFSGESCAENDYIGDLNECNQCANTSHIGTSLALSFTAFPLFMVTSLVIWGDLHGWWEILCMLCCRKERDSRHLEETEYSEDSASSSDDTDY